MRLCLPSASGLQLPDAAARRSMAVAPAARRREQEQLKKTKEGGAAQLTGPAAECAIFDRHICARFGRH
jgi:hypothetical protein